MELRVLQYFVTVADEGNFSGAARRLYLTQPTISRQIQELEDELGVKLFVREGRGVRLTEDGFYFYKKALEILILTERAKEEVSRKSAWIGGDVYIGCGETKAMRYIASAIKKMQAAYPGITCHFLSGNAESVREWLEIGLVSFGLFVLPVSFTGLDFVRLPHKDIWGVLMRNDDSLACAETISPSMFEGRKLICSHQALVANEFAGWFGKSWQHVRVVATYNLLYNASILVQERVGVALGLKGIVNTGGDSPLCFRELEPALKVDLALAWRSKSTFSKTAKVFKEFFDLELGHSR